MKFDYSQLDLSLINPDEISHPDEMVTYTQEELDERERLSQELAQEFLRQERNQLLAESDWTQSRDVILSNDAEWAAYRQALRDLPANTEDPLEPVWPTKPA